MKTSNSMIYAKHAMSLRGIFTSLPILTVTENGSWVVSDGSSPSFQVMVAELCFVLPLSMTKNEGITVNVPSASTSSPKENKEATLTLSVAQQGEIFFNKEKINFAQLPIRLQNFKSANKDPQVVVNADGKAEYSNVVAVIDEVKRTGITKVALSTDRK